MSSESSQSTSSGFFTAHLDEAGETYFEHMGIALRIGMRMVAGGLACLVHALMPFLFVRTGSNTIQQLSAFTEQRRLKSKAN